MNKYWKTCNEGLGELLIEIGKNKAKKNHSKLSAAFHKVKQKYHSLRHASRLENIPWMKFHCNTCVTKKNNSKGKFTHNLSRKDTSDIEAHFQSEDISFPLPDKKYTGKCFMRQSVKKSLTMYNLLSTTTHQISLSTYYRYKP